MGGSRYFVARDLDELGRALQLVPRGNDCIKCDHSTGLQCPKCSGGESCQFTVPLDCTQCATSGCMKDEEAESDKGGGGLNIGGIIGGIIGSIVMIAVVAYLAWRFYIKPKRSQTLTPINFEDVDPVQSSEKDAALRGTRPLSTHTVHSIAPTVLTRASNIIQIAYIPGVINRATLTSPKLLVPLVPPIPMHHTEGNRGQGNNSQRP
ncbi:Opy2 domain-containing protein [Fusarium keratoplasticum]|uniref:Opy2 domain-containing protein n=1 Tax=Fusarium keratoplasticum TaxID=1328300 RepID=A0ACC0QCH6_9HYPO|nr:Opy2 domain-containing protein [Fusarium keratoplasticum]KAI8648704.1 Opy2 domain-containing protein [Fusarium keratoplasticum]